MSVANVIDGLHVVSSGGVGAAAEKFRRAWA